MPKDPLAQAEVEAAAAYERAKLAQAHVEELRKRASE
jgi:hypothetical protein